ncbi:MAG: efflux RND transporter permease subunit [Treponema sp.]|jgi:HAE1 family hydrophobic/amphiphilic exporter-1|nr:efflux RND transporter permease subunit [Treponema sp.]
MNIVDLAIKRPVTILMGVIALVIFGLMAYVQMPASLLPNMTLPYVTIRIVYPGANPQVIENQITVKIEDQISAISGLDSTRSYSMANVSIVVAAFNLGKDENLAVQEVKEKVDAIISDLPEGAESPVITKLNAIGSSPVLSVVLDGDMSAAELFAFASGAVNDRFAQVSGVGQVIIQGGSEREILVSLDREAIYGHGIAIPQLLNFLAAANQEIPGGNFAFAGRDIPVRFRGEFSSLEEIRDMDIPTGNGIYKLRQIADVADTLKAARAQTILLDKKRGSRNENAVLLQIVKNPSANTIEVVDNVIAAIPGIEALSGNRAHLTVIQEDATYIRDTITDTLTNVILGILLTGLVLLFFLHDVKPTIIVALAMPFSVISTFLVMDALGIGLNLLSLTGLSSAIGTLVANSVVVLENIFRYRETGHSRTDSASKGTKETAAAVLASTLTNVAVFVPLGNVGGLIGPVIFQFAYTVVISTIFSLVISFTLTPLLAAKILPERAEKEKALSLKLELFFKSLEKAYRRTLTFLLERKRRSAMVIAVTAALFVLSICLAPSLKLVMMPASDGGKIRLIVELPQGSDLEHTAALLKTIESRLAAYDEIEILETLLGSDGNRNQNVNVARLNVYMVPRKNRSVSNTVFADRLIPALADIPGAKIRITAISEQDGSAAGGGIELYLKGTDTALLQEKAEAMEKIMNAIPGISHTVLGSNAGKQELVFHPNRKQISEDGLSVQSVAVSLRAAIDGLVAATYKEAGEEYDIRLTINDNSLKDIGDIRNIPIVSPKGVYPLSRYASTEFTDGTDQIMRVDKTRTVEINAGILSGYSSGNVLAKVSEALKAVELPAGYSLAQAGDTKMMTETMIDMTAAFVIAVLLTYMLLAAVLENLTRPLIILSTVPLSIIGIVLICLASGTVINMASLAGVIMLVGIVVNNAILMLDYYGQLVKKGMSLREALLEACPVKLKPILMSNIAIILGLIPMALGIGSSGAEMRQPMGMVIIGGIVSSTVMTLWLIPCLEFFLAGKQKSRETGLVK